MGWDRDRSQRELVCAVKELDTRRVGELCGELIDHVEQHDDPYPMVSARAILGALRGGRHFAQVERVADALLACTRSSSRLASWTRRSPSSTTTRRASRHVRWPFAARRWSATRHRRRTSSATPAAGTR